MSESEALSLGPVTCPRCRGEEFRLENRGVCVAVVCACGWEAGELQLVRRMEPPLLGRQVAVTLRSAGDDGPEVVARGLFLGYGEMGECVLLEDGGDVVRCWPMLEVRAVDSNVSSTEDGPEEPDSSPPEAGSAVAVAVAGGREREFRVAWNLEGNRKACVSELTDDRGLVVVIGGLLDWQAYAIVAVLDPPFSE